MKILILEGNKYRTIQMKALLQKRLEGVSIVVVETVEDAINELDSKYQQWDLVSLDHDLGGQEMVDSGKDTGYEVAKWLSENPDKQPEVIWIHSLNPVGRQNMLQLLPNAEEKPFWWSISK